MGAVVETGETARQGIDRRTMIKRAAATGAVAWTAPIIIGSLTSPAGAITGPCGCNLVRYNGQCAANCSGVSCGGSVPGCVPATTAGCQELQSCVAPVGSDCDGQSGTGAGATAQSVSFVILAGCTCNFQFGTANNANGDICDVGTISGDQQTITFAGNPGAGGAYNQFVLQLTCGTGCPPS